MIKHAPRREGYIQIHFRVDTRTLLISRGINSGYL